MCVGHEHSAGELKPEHVEEAWRESHGLETPLPQVRSFPCETAKCNASGYVFRDGDGIIWTDTYESFAEDRHRDDTYKRVKRAAIESRGHREIIKGSIVGAILVVFGFAGIRSRPWPKECDVVEQGKVRLKAEDER